MKMKEYVVGEKPREKLRIRGAKALSNAELLATLLGCGTVSKNALEVSQELMVSAGGRLTLLGAMPLEQLMQQKGVGEARAIGIAAALELGRRCFEEMAMVDKRAVTSPELVYRVMLPFLKHLDHEESWVLYLNRTNYLIGKEMITVGRLETTLIDTRRIVRKAIEKQCSQVVLVHNHPSGQALPSQADIRQTEILKKALGAVEIGLMDHVIVCEDSFFSFSEEKLVKM